MALTKIGEWNSPVSAEADRPNRPATDMKAVFDANSNQIKEAFNANVDALTIAEQTVKVNELYPNRFLAMDGMYKTPQTGEAANGVANGGTTGQVYCKHSATDYDGEWKTIRPTVYTETLAGTAWGGQTSCTKTVSGKGITASSIIFIKPVEEDYDEWTTCGVRCTASGTDTLSFVCDQIPGDVDLELVVWNY